MPRAWRPLFRFSHAKCRDFSTIIQRFGSSVLGQYECCLQIHPMGGERDGSSLPLSSISSPAQPGFPGTHFHRYMDAAMTDNPRGAQVSGLRVRRASHANLGAIVTKDPEDPLVALSPARLPPPLETPQLNE